MRNRSIKLYLLSGIFAIACTTTDQKQLTNALESGQYCYGDPDEALICVGESDLWLCDDLPNGNVKCVHTPDTQDGWICREENNQAICDKMTPGAQGGAGWDCVSDEMKTTCTSLYLPINNGNNIESPTEENNPPIEGEYEQINNETNNNTDNNSITSEVPSNNSELPGDIGWQCSVGETGIECISANNNENGSENNNDEVVPGNTTPPWNESPAIEIQKGDFRTQTQGGWGSKASGNNPGAYRDANFSKAFPTGLTIGCEEGFTLHFTDAKAIEEFLPSGGTANSLSKNITNPTGKTSAGVLAGQVLALSLSVGFDQYDPEFGASDLEITNLVATQGACKGLTLEQILKTANNILGGCSNHFSAPEITSCVDAINNDFVDGSKLGGYLGFSANSQIIAPQ